jgi:hypothetical protein
VHTSFWPRRREQLEEVALERRVAGGQAVVRPTDVTSEEEMHAPCPARAVPAIISGALAPYHFSDGDAARMDLGQLLFRPVTRAAPYATAPDDVFLCSSSKPGEACTAGAGTGWRKACCASAFPTLDELYGTHGIG